MKKVDLLNIVNKYSKDENYDFSGYLMYKDKAIAEIKDTNFIKSLEDNLLPIIMINKNIGSFESWLQTRVIDTQRTNSRQIRRRLSVRTEVPKEIVIKARAVSITDNYWLKWANESITYNEVRSRLSDGLNTVALYGNTIESNFTNLDISPELTNIGSFEKCWKLIDGHWYSTSFTKNNYKPVLEEYNYEIPKIKFEKIKSIIDETLKSFPMLEKEEGFNEVVFKIIKNNYEELLN